jgi:translation initiation factor 2B subunit (eIF-2B alpha/beta/delta family)
MNTVQRNLLKLQSDSDILMLLGLAKKWRSQSDNEDIKEMADTVLRLSAYLSSLHLERYSFDRLISESMASNHRMLDRAERAEKRIQELEEQIDKYKLKDKLGL